MNKTKQGLLMIISVTLVIRAAGNIFLPALSYMAEDLGISQVQATTNLTLYYFCLMVSFLLFGPLCDRYSKYRLLQTSLIGCLFGAILCGGAYNILMFNIGRCFQAFSAGIALLCSQIWIGDHSDKKNMMSRLAWFSLVGTLVPIFAPAIGGTLADLISWRYDFWLIFALSILGLIVTFIIPLDEVKSSKRHNSFIEILHSYNRILRQSPVFSFSLCVQVLYMGQSMFSALSSFLFIDEFGLTASLLGILSGSLVAGLLIGRFFTLYLRKHLSIRTVFLINEVVILISSVGLIAYYFFMDSHNVYEVVGMLFLQSLSFSGLAIISISNVMLVCEEDKGIASGLYNFLNNSVAWLGVLLVQLFYNAGLGTITIFNWMAFIVLIGTVVSIRVFFNAYSKYSQKLE